MSSTAAPGLVSFPKPQKFRCATKPESVGEGSKNPARLSAGLTLTGGAAEILCHATLLR